MSRTPRERPASRGSHELLLPDVLSKHLTVPRCHGGQDSSPFVLGTKHPLAALLYVTLRANGTAGTTFLILAPRVNGHLCWDMPVKGKRGAIDVKCGRIPESSTFIE